LPQSEGERIPKDICKKAFGEQVQVHIINPSPQTPIQQFVRDFTIMLWKEGTCHR
jgi:hypothetical protein